MKSFYSEYVQHCMRFYARHPHPKFRSEADKKNWIACDLAVKGFTEEQQNILMAIYRDGDTAITDYVHKVSIERNVKQDLIWKLINELERKVAKRRGLL
jgi:hypothetical protein